MESLSERVKLFVHGMASPDYYVFTLYVKDRSAASLAVYERLARLCFQHLPGKHVIKIVDAKQSTVQFEKKNILATPIVQEMPGAIKTFIGDLREAGPLTLWLRRRINPLGFYLFSVSIA